MKILKRLEGILSPRFVLTGEINQVTESLVGEVSVSARDISPPKYSGNYTFVPKAHNDQEIECQGMVMEENILVLKVPYFETSNVENGMTVYIADEV